MEEEEKKYSPETTPTLKSKKKSHGLYGFLSIRKKKVGCLPSTSDTSQENSPGPSSNNNSPVHKDSFNLPSLPRLNKSSSEERPLSDSEVLRRSDAVAKSNSSTNVALCCAITEGSRTPVHFQSDFKIRCNNNLSTMSINRQSILTRMNGLSEDLGERLPPSGFEAKLKKPASETNIVASTKKAEGAARKGFFCKKKTHKRSCSLGKSTFTNEESAPKGLDPSSLESSQSASEISPQSSPSPGEASHVRLRRRLLLSQRRSVDNIVASSSGQLFYLSINFITLNSIWA